MSDVYLYIYDLSRGLARTMSPIILGKQIDGIWHTSVVVFNKEYFYGSHGISYCPPGGTQLKEPGEKRHMGRTNVTEKDLYDHLEKLAVTRFRGGEYRLFDHNCNTFSNDLIKYLTNREIPHHILEMPNEVASTPLGAALSSALNTLSAGLNNIPQFGLDEATNKNNHSVDRIRQTFRPTFFDEPLSSDLLIHRLHLLWPGSDDGSLKSSYAADLFRLTSETDSEQILTPEHYSLLALNHLETEDQCRAVLELFRLAIWKNPELVLAMLTDPNKRLQLLADSPLPAVRLTKELDLQSAKAKLLCNCIGRCYQWPVPDDSELCLHVAPVLHLCFLLLDHEDHKTTTRELVLPEHRQVGLALAHNLALYPPLSADEAMELGSYLIHLAVTQSKSYKQPIEAIYLLRAIYFLVVRFPTVAALARACDLSGCLTAVMNEATDPDSSAIQNGEYGKGGSANDETSLDYLIASMLLDYLSTNE